MPPTQVLCSTSNRLTGRFTKIPLQDPNAEVAAHLAPSLRHPPPDDRNSRQEEIFGRPQLPVCRLSEAFSVPMAQELTTKMALATAESLASTAAFCWYGGFLWTSPYASLRPSPLAFRTCVAGRLPVDTNCNPHKAEAKPQRGWASSKPSPTSASSSIW
jgi:hypothetical protein